MAITFPTSPTTGQAYTVGDITWTYDGVKWKGQSVTATNIAGGDAGTLPYQSAANVTAQLAAGTSGYILKSTGAGAPVWGNDLAAKASLASPTFTGTITAADLTVSGTTRIKPILETVSIVVSAFAGYTYDVKTSTIKYLVVPSTNNGVVNFRGDSGTTLTSMMATGESLSVTLMITNNVAYGVSSVTIDGSSPNTFRWLGGTVPTKSSGAVDAYSFTIMKTGSSTFDVFASMSKYA